MKDPISSHPELRASALSDVADAAQSERERLSNAVQAAAETPNAAWITVRHAPYIIVISEALPPRWCELLFDFRKRMRPIAAPTRRELVRHVWRQFIELPMVDVQVQMMVAAKVVRASLDAAEQHDEESTWTPDALAPDDMLHLLHLVARSVRRQLRWPLFGVLQKGRGIDG